MMTIDQMKKDLLEMSRNPGRFQFALMARQLLDYIADLESRATRLDQIRAIVHRDDEGVTENGG